MKPGAVGGELYPPSDPQVLPAFHTGRLFLLGAGAGSSPELGSLLGARAVLLGPILVGYEWVPPYSSSGLAWLLVVRVVLYGPPSDS